MNWRDRHTVVPAVYLILRKEDKILLLRRANTGYMDGYYALPSGHLDGGETADQAACREAKEEVGVDIEPSDLRLLHTLHRKAQEGDYERIDLFFEVGKWTGEPKNVEPEKCDEVTWIPLNELPENVTPEVSQALECIANMLPYSTMGFTDS